VVAALTRDKGADAMKKNQDRKRAEVIFVKERGRITNKELSAQLGIHPATIARWRRIDDWDRKINASDMGDIGYVGDEESEREDYRTDRRHIMLLGAKIDLYLRKAELLPSEIRDLAEAKFHLMNCMEIVYDHTRFDEGSEGEDESI
jgi:hypothetical protein